MSFTCAPVESPYGDVLDRWFEQKNFWYEYNPGKCILPASFEEYAQKILDVEVRQDDVWLSSFARVGSSWCQEMVWLIGNDLNYDAASSIIQQLRAPMIESSMYFSKIEKYTTLIDNSVNFVNEQPSPRFIKTHLPYDLMPKQIKTVKPKIIYVARNPKDVCLSYYQHMQLLHNINATFEEMAECFMKGMTPMGSIWDHNLAFWKLRDDPNVLFLKYEEMKFDTRATMRRIAHFLGKSLTEAEINELQRFLSIEKLKENPGMNMSWMVDSCKKMGHTKGGNHFFGNGQSSDCENYMSKELAKKFDDWIESNSKKTGLTFS